jgi:3-deoxy-D-manno-octulosonic-acid transferase
MVGAADTGTLVDVYVACRLAAVRLVVAARHPERSIDVDIVLRKDGSKVEALVVRKRNVAVIDRIGV